ncbi:MAG: hypothetical protein LUQ67_08555, partial [Methanomicrobiales archaeon]|nr:hypothetical protein [Methanomicrobiales archaeon]
MVQRDVSSISGEANRSIRRAFTGYPGTVLTAILLAVLLACPAGAFFYMNPVGRAVKVGEVVTLSGSNSENRTTYLFVTGPYLDNEGAMLTNTSALTIDGSFDSVPVSANYSWSFLWNTSLPGISLTDGYYVVYASVVPRPRFRLTGYTYATQTLNFQGRLPVETSNITPTPTPIPTWTPPPEGTVVRASSGPSDDYPGRFDGDLIVYEARRGEGDTDIYLYNITSGNTTAVATGRAVQRSPAISGGTVVYSAYEASRINRTDADLFTYDVTSGVTR